MAQFQFWKQGVFMRELISKELDCVSGGDWAFEVDFGVVRWLVEGDESIQDIASGAADVASDAYWTARDSMADFYESMAGYFATTCNGGGGR
jgi:hypothetical protein